MYYRDTSFPAWMKPYYEMKRNQFIGYEMSLPVVRLGQVLGLLSWNLNDQFMKQTGQHHWRRIISIAYKLLMKAILFYLCAGEGMRCLRKNYQNEIVTFVTLSQCFIPVTFLILITVVCTAKTKNFEEFLQLLRTTAILNGCARRKILLHMKYNILQFALSIISWILWILDQVIKNSDVTENINFSLFVAILYGHDLFVFVLFVVSANLCAESFSVIHWQLKELMTSDISLLKRYLDRLPKKYEQVYQLTHFLQQNFPFLITIILARFSLALGTMAYKVLTANSFDSNTLCDLFTLILHSCRIFAIATAADKVSSKARGGPGVLSDIYLQSLTQGKGLKNTMALCNKLMLNPVEISAAGNLFKINMGTFVSIMATILTYLIILMQFNTSRSKDGLNLNMTAINATR